MGRNKGINWNAQPLGRMTDGELARRLGVSREAVCGARRSRGIPAYRTNKRDIDWNAQPLGRMTDSELARRLGVARKTVANARHYRGIQAFTPKRQQSLQRRQALPTEPKPDDLAASISAAQAEYDRCHDELLDAMAAIALASAKSQYALKKANHEKAARNLASLQARQAAQEVA